MDRETSGSVVGDIADVLREAIVSGSLRPEQRLHFEDMKEKYGVGVGTLREALLVLSGDSLVQSFKQRGFRVAPASVPDLIDIFENLKLIEVDALRRAILAGDDDWEAQLLASHHRMTRVERRQAANSNESLDREWEQRHLNFHESLISACGSPRLLRSCIQLREQALRYRHLAKVPRAQHPSLTSDHLPLMEAALDRDVNQACSILVRHFEFTEKVILDGMPSKAANEQKRILNIQPHP
jgi:GntR family carbon starvation induced transcriptional regulator